MDKKEIFEIIMQSDSPKINELAKEIEKKYTVETVKKCEQGLLMFRAKESVENITFNVGEILVTTGEVKIEKSLGYAMILGMDQSRCYSSAVLMALLETDFPESAMIRKLAVELKTLMIKKYQEEKEIVSSTRVKFETMGGQDKTVAHNR